MDNKNSSKPVFDQEGKVIGRTGEDPKDPFFQTTPEEKIMAGLRQKRIDAEKAIAPIVDSMSGWARQARRILDTTSQWEFGKRLEAEAKCAELRAKFKEGKKQIDAMRNDARGEFGEVTPFVNSVDIFTKGLEKHFSDDPQDFVKGRF